MTQSDLYLFITLIGPKLLVKKIADEKTTSGGIYLPETVFEKNYKGIVVATGNGYRSPKTNKWTPMEVKVNDKVAFTHYVGSPIKINGQEYILLKEDELLGIVVD